MQRSAGAMFLAFLCLGALAPSAQAMRAKTEERVNPIRKAVTMLQAMQKKVQEEGEKEQELYEKFMCFCKNGKSELAASIEAAEAKVPSVTSALEATEDRLAQTKEDLKQAQTDRAAAKDAIAEATAIREKDAEAYAAEKAEYDANIGAVKKALPALEKGMGSFLQTQEAVALKNIVGKVSGLGESDREDLTAFLSGASGYSPQSGQIVGILSAMLDEMEKSLADATAAEESAIKAFEELETAKGKEIEALTQAIETKTAQVGDLGIEIVSLKADLSDTAASLKEDKEFLANMDETCKTKTAEWEERSKTRAKELVALAETIKVLNDDDALELFKKTLPSPGESFMQFRTTSKDMQQEAMAALRQARGSAISSNRAGFDMLLLALASRGGSSKAGFEKVVALIDNMVGVLKQEQQDDDDKMEYCEMQLDTNEDKKKVLERKVEDEDKAAKSAEDAIATLTSEIAALEAGIVELDKQVQAATVQRKAENAEYKDLMASNGAAKELLRIAQNRLNKFYNPKLYVPPPKQDLSREDQIVEGMGGTVPTPAPSGIAGTGVTAFAQLAMAKGKAAPPPPPDTWGAYSKKSEESNGVIAMIDLLIADLDKEMTEAETDEKNAQEEYEKLITDSAMKRTTDSKALSEKGTSKADLEGALEGHKEAKMAAGLELMAVMKLISNLHGECDWLIQYHSVRKEARTNEVDALEKAKAVLSGADFS